MTVRTRPFLARTFRASDGHVLPVYVRAPSASAAARPLRLLVHLHGGMERGGDPARLLATGLARRLRRAPIPGTVVVLPQCPRGRTWLDLLRPLVELVVASAAIHGIPAARVALTGVSMGGAGAWALGALRPDLFGVVLPICGPVPDRPGWPARARRLAGTRVRVFHGGRDPVVPVDDSIRLVDATRRAGGDVALFVYPDAAHEAWEPAYDDPAFVRELGVRPPRS